MPKETLALTFAYCARRDASEDFCAYLHTSCIRRSISDSFALCKTGACQSKGGRPNINLFKICAFSSWTRNFRAWRLKLCSKCSSPRRWMQFGHTSWRRRSKTEHSSEIKMGCICGLASFNCHNHVRRASVSSSLVWINAGPNQVGDDPVSGFIKRILDAIKKCNMHFYHK